MEKIVSQIVRAIVIAFSGLVLTLGLGACTTTDEAVKENQEATSAQLKIYNDTQPIPLYDYSQYRETLLSIQDAQANGLATTSFFFNLGADKPIKSCPSIGYPVPTTTQLTSPDQPIRTCRNGDCGWNVLGQMEPTGVYSGNSTGTYVVCIKGGKPTVDYWEGFVQTEGGPARWDPEQQLIVPTGKSTVTVDSPS